MKLSKLSLLFSAALLLIVAINGSISLLVLNAFDRAQTVADQRVATLRVVEVLHQEMDALSRLVRTYVVTGQTRYLGYYHAILDIREGRKPVVEDGDPSTFWDRVIAGQTPFVPPVVDEKDAEKLFKEAVATASKRTIDDAMPGIRSCRDSRAALRPELTGTLKTKVVLDGEGMVKSVEVKATNASDDDEALDNCVSVLLQSLPFFPSGLKTTITIEHSVDLPPPRDVSSRKCSATSFLPVSLRRGIWRERMFGGNESATVDLYRRAKASCEVPTWTDRRVFLELLLERVTQPLQRVSVARRLDILGEADARGFQVTPAGE